MSSILGLVVTGTFGVTSAGNAAIVGPLDTTGSNLIIAVLSNATANAAVLTDSQGNTWTALTRQAIPAAGAIEILYCFNPSISTTHTFTVPAAVNNLAALSIMCVSNGLSFDQQNGSGGSSTGNITPTVNNELIIAGYQSSNGSSISLSGVQYGDFGSWPVIGGNRFAHCAGFWIQQTAAVTSTTFTGGGALNDSAAIASFKLSSISGGGTLAAVF